MITDECRRESHEKVNKAKRYMQIREILKGNKMTAKEIAVEMFKRNWADSTDRNYSAPRLTELEKEKRLVEIVGKKKCEYTGKMVSVYMLIEDDLSMKEWEQIKMMA